MENIEFLHAQLSLARKIAVSHKYNILNDRIFLQISGRKQISAQPVINGTTVPCCLSIHFGATPNIYPINTYIDLKWFFLSLLQANPWRSTWS